MPKQVIPMVGQYDRDLFGMKGPLHYQNYGNGVVPSGYNAYWYGAAGHGNGWGGGMKIHEQPRATAFKVDWGYPK